MGGYLRQRSHLGGKDRDMGDEQALHDAASLIFEHHAQALP